ncbi:MAG: phage integrase SAM-like domain-containing protein [Phocaeicola vulgatus]
MDSDLMTAYEAWLRSKEISMNTISFYMRILRATYNRAVEKGPLSPSASPSNMSIRESRGQRSGPVPWRAIKTAQDVGPVTASGQKI